MEREGDYVDLMRQHDKLKSLTEVYRTTTELNSYLSVNLSANRSFQFPVVSNNTLQDVIAYYLSTVNENGPDEEPADAEHTKLGKYIEDSYVRSQQLVGAIYALIENRVEGYPLTPENEYTIYLLKLISERDGALAVAYWFSAALEEKSWPLEYYYSGECPNLVLYALYKDIGLTDSLIYVSGFELYYYIFDHIDEVTDKAARSFEYFKWATVVEPGKRFLYYDEKNARYMCVLLTLAKLMEHSPSKQAFEWSFRLYVKYILGNVEPKNVLEYLFEGVTWLLYKVDDGDYFYEYLDYMVKALAYAESVYGTSLLDVLGEVNEEQEEVIKILAGEY